MSMEEMKEYIFPKLLSSETLREVEAQQFLPYLFSPKEENEKSLLKKKEFESLIIPFIISQFNEKDRNIRITMLKQFHIFVSYIPLNSLKNNLAFKILSGLDDKENQLVFSTLDSLPFFFKFLNKTDTRNFIFFFFFFFFFHLFFFFFVKIIKIKIKIKIIINKIKTIR